MTKDRPKNVAASVRDRLLNIAREIAHQLQEFLLPPSTSGGDPETQCWRRKG